MRRNIFRAGDIIYVNFYNVGCCRCMFYYSRGGLLRPVFQLEWPGSLLRLRLLPFS